MNNDKAVLGTKDVHAMLAVKDLEVGRKFYGERLGFEEVGRVGDEVVTYRSGNSSFTVYRSQYAGTNKATSVTWEVDDAEATAKTLRAKGISFEHYKEMSQMELRGDVYVAEGMKTAWFKDPDGNILSIMSH